MSENEEPEGNEGADPVALAATEQPVPLLVALVEDERVPEGMVCMATYRGERMIARVVMPPQAWDEVEKNGWFAEPRQVVLVAREASPGLQCQLFAVLPIEAVEEEDDDDAGEGGEPWAASVPSSAYEKAVADDDDDDGDGKMAAFPLGNIVRFAADRVHPDDLALEAVDVLRKIIDGRTTEVVDRALRDLLGE